MEKPIRETKPNHKIVPDSSLLSDDGTLERFALQVSEFLKRGTLPKSMLERMKKRNEPKEDSQPISSQQQSKIE